MLAAPLLGCALVQNSHNEVVAKWLPSFVEVATLLTLACLQLFFQNFLNQPAEFRLC
jgi:hypothetical protein